MLTEPTVDKLKAMRLEGLLQAWLDQRADPGAHDLGFDERLGLLVDAEWIHRENKRPARGQAETQPGLHRGHRLHGQAPA